MTAPWFVTRLLRLGAMLTAAIALTAAASGCTGNEAASSTPAPQRTEASRALVTRTEIGGWCVDASPCGSTTVINAGGAVKRNGHLVRRLTAQQVAQLSDAVADLDLRAVERKKFAGVCPRLTDGTERIYRLADASTPISSCSSALKGVRAFDLIDAYSG